MPDPAAPEETRLPTAAEWPAIASLWKKTGRELVARFGGTSMEPTISPEAELLLRCGDQAEPGDVIAVLIHDQVVVHRVEARGRGFILTRGDAQILPDVPVRDPAAVIGRVVGIRQGEGWREPDAPPRSWARAVVRSVFASIASVSPPAAAVALGALLALRRRFVALLGGIRLK